MFTETWIALYNIMNWLIATTTLNAVFNYDIKTIESFPSASISLQEWDEIYLDQLLNQIDIKYIIRIYDQNKSVALMEARMRLLVDNIMITLRNKSNCGLWWTANRITFSYKWWWQDNEQPIRVCEITCNILTTEII